MDSSEKKQDDSPDTHSLKPRSNNIWILLLALLVFLLSVVFVQNNAKHTQPQNPGGITLTQKPTNITQVPSTGVQGTPDPCSKVPYYCLINGGGKCNVPSICPIPSISLSNVPPALLCVPPAQIPAKLIVHFDFAVFNINTADMPALNKYAAALKLNPSITVTIEGNTDSIDTTAFNQKLSQDRAQAVKNYLVSKGAAANKYILIGNGETKPVAPNTINGKDNPAGRALNRRAEITAQSNGQNCNIPSTQPSNPIPQPSNILIPSVNPAVISQPILSLLPSIAGVSPGAAQNVPPNSSTCSGKYSISNPMGKNFGDPNCNFDKNQLFTLLKQLDPANAVIWFNTVIPCESAYNPNAVATGAVDPAGAWGLFQMGRGNNGTSDHGDVEWHLQYANAINYNNAQNNNWRYWSCAKAFWK